MKVRIIDRQGYGDRFGVFHPAGTIADLPDAIAVKLLQHGIAKPALAPKRETAELAPAENAAHTIKPAGRPRKEFLAPKEGE